jgi:hypothetical protein
MGAMFSIISFLCAGKDADIGSSKVSADFIDRHLPDREQRLVQSFFRFDFEQVGIRIAASRNTSFSLTSLI